MYLYLFYGFRSSIKFYRTLKQKQKKYNCFCLEKNLRASGHVISLITSGNI